MVKDKPVAHHHLPQGIQKRWVAKDGMVLAMRNYKIFRTKPINVASENHAYTVPSLPDPQMVEKKLASLDDRYISLTEKLIFDSENFTLEDRLNLVLEIRRQFDRTPIQRELNWYNIEAKKSLENDDYEPYSTDSWTKFKDEASLALLDNKLDLGLLGGVWRIITSEIALIPIHNSPVIIDENYLMIPISPRKILLIFISPFAKIEEDGSFRLPETIVKILEENDSLNNSILRAYGLLSMPRVKMESTTTILPQPFYDDFKANMSPEEILEYLFKRTNASEKIENQVTQIIENSKTASEKNKEAVEADGNYKITQFFYNGMPWLKPNESFDKTNGEDASSYLVVENKTQRKIRLHGGSSNNLFIEDENLPRLPENHPFIGKTVTERLAYCFTLSAWQAHSILYPRRLERFNHHLDGSISFIRNLKDYSPEIREKLMKEKLNFIRYSTTWESLNNFDVSWIPDRYESDLTAPDWLLESSNPKRGIDLVERFSLFFKKQYPSEAVKIPKEDWRDK